MKVCRKKQYLSEDGNSYCGRDGNQEMEGERWRRRKRKQNLVITAGGLQKPKASRTWAHILAPKWEYKVRSKFKLTSRGGESVQIRFSLILGTTNITSVFRDFCAWEYCPLAKKVTMGDFSGSRVSTYCYSPTVTSLVVSADLGNVAHTSSLG